MSPKSITLNLGGLVFLLFAYWQFNDQSQYGNTDAWAWIVIYTLSAILSFSCATSYVRPAVLYIWFGFTIGALTFRLQDDQGNFDLSRLDPSKIWNQDQTLMIQNSNESSGLLILVCWALLMLYLNNNHREK
ncbi:transmembrane 220 family protein [Glaciecola petra]|uniref:Transmembrane 220 family protein n=1 Tax=Glaciecola petra TaxID=3075602 RepID=A0ABU2ZTT3_9ALTE|nr:transmembrane 220 family protein [Aestuariibacter sp. P117]MDT0594817.1 transmembrane 220 family protein [Aestuariibacter sp. P117]